MGSPSSSRMLLKRYFIYQRTTNPKRLIRMKVCQSINSIGLPVKCPFTWDEVIKSRTCWRGLHQNKHRAPGRALNHERTAGTQDAQFASNDIARYHALGVAESICNGCHSSFALFKKFFQWVGFCRAFALTFDRLAGVMPNSLSIALIRFHASAFMTAAGCGFIILISRSPPSSESSSL